MKLNQEKTNQEALLTSSASDFNTKLLELVSLNELLAWSLQEENPRLAFRSSWALEHLLLKNVQLFDGIHAQVIDGYNNLKNWSALRSYSKLLMWLCSKKNQQYTLSDVQEIALIEKSFFLLDQPNCPVAVKVNVMDILHLQIEKHDWIRNELKLLIELELEKGATPALRSRGAYILKRILKA
ncbi:hypothetical protein ACFRAE_04285 [Sphingobacterium sp. HJSM2_6]|uniref:hypothetical protein n=1 Tax=Sphingobacterium sp. HJSM2_6 TaxID=3366264 RepID=UPI003BCC3700